MNQATGLPVHCYLSGKLGGGKITARVACDEVDLVLFFRDPLRADSGSSNEQNLLRLCDMHSVPIATNIATAEVLLRGIIRGYWTTGKGCTAGDRASGRSPPAPCAEDCLTFFVSEGNVKTAPPKLFRASAALHFYTVFSSFSGE